MKKKNEEKQKIFESKDARDARVKDFIKSLAKKEKAEKREAAV